MHVPFSVSDFIDRAAQVYGDRVALVDEPDQPARLEDLTFSEMKALATRQAAKLDELGIGFGDRVAIVSPNSSRLLTSFFGVAGHGRVLVPVNFRLRSDEVDYIVKQSGARMLLVDPELDDDLAKVTAEHRLVLGRDELYAAEGAVPGPWTPDEDATAYINYTSGTTARPKGVQITHRNAWINAVTFGLHTGITDRDVYLHTLPMFHANGWGVPFVSTSLGVPQIVLRKAEGAEILRRVERHGVTLMCAAPAVLASIMDAAASWEGDLPGRGQVRIIAGGAPPATRTVMRIEQELGWEFMQGYGLTECSPLVTMNRARSEWDILPAEDRAQRLASAGAPALGVSLLTTGDGEVLVRSNVVMAGYWDQPDETAKAIVDGWFHTGDGGVISDGYLTIKDRKKDVIISGGENVSASEVEDVLYSHPSVSEVAIIGVPHEKWGETVKALVVLANGSATSEEELILWCKERLAGYKAPTSVEFRSELARTATGKLQKFKLRAPYWERQERRVI